MADERIDIQIDDKVAPTIVEKMQGIAKAARDAFSYVEKLKQELAAINVSAITKLYDAVSHLTSQEIKLAAAQNATAQAQAKAALTSRQLQAEILKTAAAEQKLQQQMLNTAAATAKASAAQTKLASGGGSGGGLNNAIAGRIGALIGTALSVRAIVDATNAYDDLHDKLLLVAKSQDDFNKSFSEVPRIAIETHQSIDDVAQAYQRFTLGGNSLRLSQDKVLQITENVSKAIAVSGQSAEKGKAGLDQLSKAFAAGGLQGRQFQQLIANIPEAAKILADQLTGGSVPALKALSMQGKITSDELAKAFENSGKGIEDLNKKFSQASPNIGDALRDVGSAFQQFIGAEGVASGATNTVAAALEILANHIEVLAPGIVLVAAALSAKLIPALIEVTTLLAANPVIAFGIAIVAVISYIAAMSEKSELFKAVWVEIKTVVGNSILFIAKGIAGWLQLFDRVVDGVNTIKQAFDGVPRAQSQISKGITEWIQKIEEAKSAGKDVTDVISQDLFPATNDLAGAAQDTSDWFAKVRTNSEAAGNTAAAAFQKATYEINRATVALQEYDRQLPGGAKIISVYPQLGGVDSRDISGVYGNGTSSNASGGGTRSYALGGHISGPGTGRSDSIPAMLSNGEFVVNAAAASKYRTLLERINNSSIRHYADGGLVDQSTIDQARSLKANYDQLATQMSALRSEEYRLKALLQQARLDHDDNAIASLTDQLQNIMDQETTLGRSLSAAINAMRQFEDRSINEYEKHTYTLGGNDLKSLEASGLEPYIGLNGSPGGWAFTGNYSQEILDAFSQQRAAITEWNKELDSWWKSAQSTIPGADRSLVDQMVRMWESGNRKNVVDPRPWIPGGPIGAQANPDYNKKVYTYGDVRSLIAHNGYLTSILAASPIWGDTVGQYVKYSGPTYGGVVNYGGDNPGPVDYSIPNEPNINPRVPTASDVEKFFGGPRFQTGGSFIVGGDGGPDSQLVQFMASPNERVTVQTPQQQQQNSPAAINVPITMNINGADPRGWKASEQQVVASLSRKVKDELRRSGALP